MGFKGYLAKRILFIIPALLAVIILDFAIMHAAPGDPVTMMVASIPVPVTAEMIEQIRFSMGLQGTVPEQLFRYISNVLQGDLGNSLFMNAPVADIVFNKLPNTILLMGTAYIISLVAGIFLGVMASRKPYSMGDNITTGITLVVYSMPAFWLAMLFALVFGYYLRWFPTSGFSDFGTHGLDYYLSIGRHLVLPALVVGLGRMALYTRLTRANMLEVLKQDYITTAWSKGCGPRKVYFKHALGNALLPVTTVAGMDIRRLAAGSVLVEKVFAWPGVGDLLWTGVLQRDYTLLMGIFIVMSMFIIVANLIVDILYGLIDPRIGYA